MIEGEERVILSSPRGSSSNDDARLVVVFAANQHDLCLGLGCLLSLDLALALPLAQPITVEVGLGGVGLRG